MQDHIRSEAAPQLSLCEKSREAWAWNSNSVKIDRIVSADIYEEEDLEIRSEDFVERLESED